MSRPRPASTCAVARVRAAEAGSRGEVGYALLAVLWILVGVAGLTLLMAASARNAIAPSRNRFALAAATWSAAGCLALARAVLTEAFKRERPQQADVTSKTWDRVDRILAVSPPFESGCKLEARPVGARVDVNANDEATLARLLRYAGMAAAPADSAARALSSNKPYVDVRELHLVPGLESTTLLDSLLDVEPGPIALNHAPSAVLALLPGFTAETVRRVIEARAEDAAIVTFSDLAPLLSPDDRGAAARLPGLVVFQPVAWVIQARASAGRPVVTAVVEMRLARWRTSTAVTRQKSWVE